MEKNIVILGPAHPLRGGIAVFNERLTKAFQDHGSYVTIETFKLQYPGFLFPGKTQFADWDAPSHLNVNVSVNSINPFNWIKIGRRLKKLKPDIIIVGYWLPFMAPCFGTICRIAKKNRHTKAISILHNIIPHEGMPASKLLSKFFAKSMDAFIAMSKSVLKDLGTINTDKPRTFCPHPLYDNFGEKIDHVEAIKKLNLDNDYRYILFFGLIRDYKGLDLLIKAFADERFRSHKIKLIIAGEFYSDEEKYTSLINELNIAEYVILHNKFIPNPEVGLYFGACDIVAQPYKSATQSGVTQIGYHFEKPMLVTNVGGLGEIIPNNKVGYVVEPNPKDIADKLLDFFTEDRKGKFIQNVIIEKKKYSWDTMTDAVFNTYKEI